MTARGESWRTGTGLALAWQCIDSASQGRPVILCARRAGALEQIAEAAGQFGCDPLFVEPRHALTPLACIAAAAGITDRAMASGSLLTLISAAALRDAIICAKITQDDTASWLSFAGVFATARRSFQDRAAGLIVISASPLQAPAGCEAMADDMIVDVIDAMAAIRSWTQWRLDLATEMAMATAVEVTRGDLDLLRELVEGGPDVAFDPISWLRARPPQPSANPLLWRGRQEDDPVWLVRADLAKLRTRIWRGQLAILFPWLEMLRIDYLLNAGSRWIESDEDLAALEFTPLISRMSDHGGDPHHIRALQSLRFARNELAHCRSISRPQASLLMKTAAVLTR